MSGDLNPRYSFDTYVVGTSNQVAFSAARSVAESPGSSYNPLFIFGPTGLGKTHLLMAIGQAALAASESLSVEYVTMDEFLEAYQVAVATGHGDSFRSRFDGVDVLLLDDVQFLTHRSDMQAELLRIISEMQQAGRQVVLTSDQAPADIEGIDEQLVSKFDGGLVVDVAPPDGEARLAILRVRALWQPRPR